MNMNMGGKKGQKGREKKKGERGVARVSAFALLSLSLSLPLSRQLCAAAIVRMECLDATGAVRITRRATPARVSKRQGRVTVATTAADADGKSEAEKERDVPSANVRVFDILRELDGIMVGANNAALNGVRAFVNKCKWDPSRAAAAATAEEGTTVRDFLSVFSLAEHSAHDRQDAAP